MNRSTINLIFASSVTLLQYSCNGQQNSGLAIKDSEDPFPSTKSEAKRGSEDFFPSTTSELRRGAALASVFAQCFSEGSSPEERPLSIITLYSGDAGKSFFITEPSGILYGQARGLISQRQLFVNYSLDGGDNGHTISLVINLGGRTAGGIYPAIRTVGDKSTELACVLNSPDN